MLRNKNHRSLGSEFVPILHIRIPKTAAMKTQNHYAPVSEAITALRHQGFALDFCIEDNFIVADGKKFKADDFEIAEIYRYEGDSDPGDEATVYGLESKSGQKGILITGMGMSSDSDTLKLLQKLQHRQ